MAGRSAARSGASVGEAVSSQAPFDETSRERRTLCRSDAGLCLHGSRRDRKGCWSARNIRLMDADQVALIGAIGGAVGAATGVTALALQGWQFHLSGSRVRVGLANGLRVPDLGRVSIG